MIRDDNVQFGLYRTNGLLWSRRRLRPLIDWLFLGTKYQSRSLITYSSENGDVHK